MAIQFTKSLKTRVIFLIALVVGACASSNRSEGLAAKVAKNPCSLVSREEIAELEGEGPAEVNGSVHSSGGATVAQCFYRMAEYSKSVTVEVTVPEAAGGQTVRKLWNERFGKHEDEEERERRERGEKEESANEVHAIPVQGLGHEAAWTGNRVSGALYVRTPSAILRISVGGAGDISSKIERARAVAEKAMRRL